MNTREETTPATVAEPARGSRADMHCHLPLDLAASPLRRSALAAGGLRAVRARTWERTLALLGDGYRRALGAAPEANVRGPRAA